MKQSIRIIRQIVKNFPGGDWYAQDARKIFAPPKDKVLTSMEELINNFMIVTEGPQMPAGEVYFEAENPKGVLGFYIVSKGGGVPYRLKIRAPGFPHLAALEVPLGRTFHDGEWSQKEPCGSHEGAFLTCRGEWSSRGQGHPGSPGRDVALGAARPRDPPPAVRTPGGGR